MLSGKIGIIIWKRLVYASFLVILGLALFHFKIAPSLRRPKTSPRLVFTTNRPPFLPHLIGGGVRAKFGDKEWGFVEGCYPFVVKVIDSPYVLFVHDIDHSDAHSFVCIDTNNGIILESERFRKALRGPCPGFVEAQAAFDLDRIKYSESNAFNYSDYTIKIFKTNFAKSSGSK